MHRARLRIKKWHKQPRKYIKRAVFLPLWDQVVAFAVRGRARSFTRLWIPASLRRVGETQRRSAAISRTGVEVQVEGARCRGVSCCCQWRDCAVTGWGAFVTQSKLALQRNSSTRINFWTWILVSPRTYYNIIGYNNSLWLDIFIVPTEEWQCIGIIGSKTANCLRKNCKKNSKKNILWSWLKQIIQLKWLNKQKIMGKRGGVGIKMRVTCKLEKKFMCLVVTSDMFHVSVILV